MFPKLIYPSNKCVQCNVKFTEGDIVRSIHPERYLIHPQFHIYPHGMNARNEIMLNVCEDRHTEPHIHDECKKDWAKAKKVKVPKTYQGIHFEEIDNMLLEELEPSRKEKIISAFRKLTRRN